MRQKVGIAIALSNNAQAILMDEPTSGLDPKATDEFTSICLILAHEGKAIFMATHDIFNAVNVGTRIGIMKEGALIHDANTNDITPISFTRWLSCRKEKVDFTALQIWEKAGKSEVIKEPPVLNTIMKFLPIRLIQTW